MSKNGQRIRLFSHILRYCCYIGMAGMLVSPLLDWVYDGCWLFGCQISPASRYLSNIPDDYDYFISFKMKMVIFFLDVFQNIFFVAAFYVLSKLLKLYEQHKFFTKGNEYYIRLVGVCLLLSQLIRPFYILLKEYMFALSFSRAVIPLSHLIHFQTLFLACVLFLISYIIVEGNHFEEEYNATV